MFAISICRQSHNDCCQNCPCACDLGVQTEPWWLLSEFSLCLWCHCADTVIMTAVIIVLASVISVCRQNHDDCYRNCPFVCNFSLQAEPQWLLSDLSCVCDFSVIHTEPWGRLSASSLLAFCFNSVCTAAWAKFTQVTSVSPTANNNNNNNTSQHLPALISKTEEREQKSNSQS